MDEMKIMIGDSPVLSLDKKDMDMQKELNSLRNEVSQTKEENKKLKEELNKFKVQPFLVGEVMDILKDGAIIKLPNQNVFFVKTWKDIDVKVGDQVFLDQKNLTVLGRYDRAYNFRITDFVITEKPQISWKDVGGLEKVKQDLREVIELPLLFPKKLEKLGIEPPKGVLLYGPPGTGKTLLAKAVANSTHATFIELSAPELVQKFIGDGARLVKDLFNLAREKAPSIIFIDEIDAIAAERMEKGTGAEREVQRTFMQLLAELDGFKPLEKVKMIAATNRVEIMDEAILRPGRFDRLIEVPKPDYSSRIEILKIHTHKANVKNINFEELAEMTDNFNGAELRSLVTEAGYEALRKNKDSISMNEFKKVVATLKKEIDQTHQEMFS